MPFAAQEWLAGTFSVADIMMADVFRLIDWFDGLAMCPVCHGNMPRAEARPPLAKTYAGR